MPRIYPARQKVEAMAFPLWQASLNDREIARKLGCHEDTVAAWRRRNGLEPNVFGKVLSRLDEYGREMHADGLTDREIAERIGCRSFTVCNWRKRCGLPSNGNPGSEAWQLSLRKAIEGRDKVLTTHSAGLTDVEGAKWLGISIGCFRSRRYRLGLKPNKSRKEAQYAMD